MPHPTHALPQATNCVVSGERLVLRAGDCVVGAELLAFRRCLLGSVNTVPSILCDGKNWLISAAQLARKTGPELERNAAHAFSRSIAGVVS